MKKHDGWDIFLLIVVAIYNLGALLFTMLWIFTNIFARHKQSLGTLTSFNVNENVTYSLFFAGVLGGAFYCLRAFYQRLGQVYTPVESDQVSSKSAFNIKVWFFWYLYRPIQGGVIALIILTLLNSKLISLQTLEEDSLKSFYSLIAVGFLCGFGSHEVIHKIQEVIKVVFAKAMNTGSNSEQKVKENNQNQ
jgi:hypothetical protein